MQSPTPPHTLPHCQAKPQAQKIAHWPALLEAWLSAPEKQRFVIDSAGNHTGVDFWMDV
ncbi:MAG: hypothetical protein IPH35_03450 [Rhodoferax sp.]|nr:hypothetical protein [Rhodoferax sp.]